MAKVINEGSSVKSNVKIRLRYPKIDFDELQIYCGIPYKIDLDDVAGNIDITLPLMEDFIKTGEKNFLQSVNILTTNTTEYRVPLWDAGIDWNVTSDFELFCMLYKKILPEVSMMFFNINLADFALRQKDNKIVLYNEKLNVEINEDVYQHMCQYIRIIFHMNVEEKITQDEGLKQMYIRKDRIAFEHNKKDGSGSSIQALISSCVNHPGFKYKLNEVLKMSIYEFYDSVSRLQVYENTTALLRGMYSGFVDSSKIKPENYNFMKKI